MFQLFRSSSSEVVFLEGCLPDLLFFLNCCGLNWTIPTKCQKACFADFQLLKFWKLFWAQLHLYNKWYKAMFLIWSWLDTALSCIGYMVNKPQAALLIVKLQGTFLFSSSLWALWWPHFLSELDGNFFFHQITSWGNFLVKKMEKRCLKKIEKLSFLRE
jgi:hypothetical protein